MRKKLLKFSIIMVLVLMLLPVGCAKQAETPVPTQVAANSSAAAPTVKESVTITPSTPGGTSTPAATPEIKTVEPEAGVVRRDPFMAPIGKPTPGTSPTTEQGRVPIITDTPPSYTLTGVFNYLKKAYAILSDAETNHIVKQGEKVGGFTLTKVDIKKKLVVLTSTKGTNFSINLQEPGQQPAGTPGAGPGVPPPGAPPPITPPGGAVPPGAPPSGEGTPPGGGIPPGAPPQ